MARCSRERHREVGAVVVRRLSVVTPRQHTAANANEAGTGPASFMLDCALRRSVAGAGIGLHILAARIAVIATALSEIIAGRERRWHRRSRRWRHRSRRRGRARGGRKSGRQARRRRWPRRPRSHRDLGAAVEAVGSRRPAAPEAHRPPALVDIVFGDVGGRPVHPLRIVIPDAADIPPPAGAAVVTSWRQRPPPRQDCRDRRVRPSRASVRDRARLRPVPAAGLRIARCWAMRAGPCSGVGLGPVPRGLGRRAEALGALPAGGGPLRIF